MATRWEVFKDIAEVIVSRWPSASRCRAGIVFSSARYMRDHKGDYANCLMLAGWRG